MTANCLASLPLQASSPPARGSCQRRTHIVDMDHAVLHSGNTSHSQLPSDDIFDGLRGSHHAGDHTDAARQVS